MKINTKRKRLHDLFLISLCIVFPGILYFVFDLMSGGSGGMVQIQADGVVVATLPINRDTVYEYRDGEDYNIIEIKNKTVFVKEADCSGNECVRQGRISRRGQSVICLPHKLIITIVGEDTDNNNELDGVAG